MFVRSEIATVRSCSAKVFPAGDMEIMEIMSPGDGDPATHGHMGYGQLWHFEDEKTIYASSPSGSLWIQIQNMPA